MLQEFSKRGFTSLFLLVLCIAAPVLIQIQTTILETDSYLGLRVNLADFLLPVAGPVIIISLLLKKSAWPVWNLRHMYVWLGILFSILLGALIHSYLLYGGWSYWALYNKVLGWPVLCAYLCLGAWIAGNADRTLLKKLLRAFFYFFLIVLLIQMVLMVAQDFTPLRIKKWIWFPLEGLMANRNAYAFLMLIVTSCVLANALNGYEYFSKRASDFYFLILPLGMMDTGSRAAFLAFFVLVFLSVVIYRKAAFKALLPFLIGVALTTAVYAHAPQKLTMIKWRQVEIARQADKIVKEGGLEKAQGHIANQGDSNRLMILKDALEMLEQKPLEGSGLGSTFLYQTEKHGEVIDVIDNTSLWLMVEAGLIGFSVFAIFYALCLKTLLCSYWKSLPEHHVIYLTALFTLLMFAVMSLFHEILYFRPMWFVLGLALALPKTRPAE